MSTQAAADRRHRKKESVESWSQKSAPSSSSRRVTCDTRAGCTFRVLQVVSDTKMPERKLESGQADLTVNDTDGKTLVKEARGMDPAECSRRALWKSLKMLWTVLISSGGSICAWAHGMPLLRRWKDNLCCHWWYKTYHITAENCRYGTKVADK